jgi:site-specific DNA-methyltransferase (adenine-specific)
MKVDTELVINLKTDSSNPNKMTKQQLKSVANSIKKYGFIVPIIVNKDNVIIDGHQRLTAAESIDIEEVPVVKLDVDKVDAKLLKQILNKLKGTHDPDMDLEEYKAIYEEQGNLDVLKEYVAMSDEEINIIKQGLDKIKHTEEELDEIPEVKKTHIKSGDLFKLGRSYLLCGDSTNFANVKKMLKENKIKLAFTSPPYNINSKMYATYKDNLESEDYVKFNLKILSMFKELLRDDGIIGYNILYNANSKFEYINIIYKAITKLNLKLLETIIWKKKGMPITNDTDLTRDYEFVYVMGKEYFEFGTIDINQMAVLSKNYKVRLNKNRNKVISNFWNINNNKIQIKNNKACFPVDLALKAIKLFSNKGDFVLDPFAGSGTTLIAAEELDRISYNIELDPKLCEVICQRWENLTGKKRKKVN